MKATQAEEERLKAITEGRERRLVSQCKTVLLVSWAPCALTDGQARGARSNN
jgi:hypothetical protein